MRDPARWMPLIPCAVGAGVVLVAGAGGSSMAAAGTGAGLGLAGALAVAWLAAQSRRRLGQIKARAREGSVEAGGDLRAAGDPIGEVGLAVEALRERLSAQVKELAKKTRNLESLIDALGEPLLVTDNADDVLLCNRPAEAMLGSPAGGLAGRNVREIFTRAEVLELHAAARRGTSSMAQVPITTPAGPRVYQASAAPLPPAWGEGVFGVVLLLRDVTALAHAARTRTDFVASASHELRTPVAAIQAAAETLGDGAADDPAMRERLLGMIASHCQRLERLTRNLIELSRLESPDLPANLAPLDWDALTSSLEQAFVDTLAGRRQRLEFAIDPSAKDAPWESDQALLELILRNLIDNAAKFGREGEPIRVTARVRSAGRRETSRARGTLRLEVIDRGIGIPLEHQPRVFERFYQVDPSRTAGPTGSRRGTGLGLSLVKHAALALGGQVGLDSVWERGTTVWAEVPVEA